MEDVSSDSLVPSMASNFLVHFFGSRVSRIARYSWWPAEQSAKECGIDDDLVFSLTAGPLAVYFDDGSVVGVASDPSLNSVIVWNEGRRALDKGGCALGKDDELFEISATSRFARRFWRSVVGSRLTGMVILKNKIMSPKESARCSEVGLRFCFEGGMSFVASHGLHDNSDDFSVLEESQLIEGELNEISIVKSS